MEKITLGLRKFTEHYQSYLPNVRGEDDLDSASSLNAYHVFSPEIKAGNHPRIFHHGKPTKDVLILFHGLSDSPYFMEAIGHHFYQEGMTVILPLLPGHGLVHPKKYMFEQGLSVRWKSAVNEMVTLAQNFGERISLGGLSTGGALSLNYILRYPEVITGGLFLFAAALRLQKNVEQIGALLINTTQSLQSLQTPMNDSLSLAKNFIEKLQSRTPFFAKTLHIPLSLSQQFSALIHQPEDLLENGLRYLDKDYEGVGVHPYKYPKVATYGVYHLMRIIKENNTLLEQTKFSQPIFAAYSAHDTTTLPEGVWDLFDKHEGNQILMMLSESQPIEHSSVVLEKDIQGENQKVAQLKNPQFSSMMQMALSFYRDYISR